MKVHYPFCLIGSVVNEFQKAKECEDNKSLIIPPSQFEIIKPLISTEMHYVELDEITQKHFLKKFQKLPNKDFRVVITWKTRNIHHKIYNIQNFLSKMKAVINGVLSIKDIVLLVHVTLVKLSATQKLDGMNMLIQRKAQNHRNIFEEASNTVLNGLSFQMLRKKLRSGRTLKHHIYCSADSLS